MLKEKECAERDACDKKGIDEVIKEMGFMVFTDENGTVWLEHSEYGFILLDLFITLMITGGHINEHKQI